MRSPAETRENDAALLGGFIAALLSFIAGFYLPMVLTPGSNQGPLTGLFIAPVAGVAGAILGSKIVQSRSSHLRAFLIALIAGTLFTTVFFIRESRHPDQGEDRTYLGCAFLIFGLTGSIVHLVCWKGGMREPSPPHHD